jgi:hydrogenase maturation protein HypF
MGGGQACGAAIRVRGIVQGVGFRPLVWRLASRFELRGEVSNDSEGVLIRAWGEPKSLDALIRALRDECPPLARIDAIERRPLDTPPDTVPSAFRIVASRRDDPNTAVSPDAAACPECLAEVADPKDRRYRYPLTNCTHCGPRFSILKAIPYDRANTSMAMFKLCPECLAEYRSPADRRFHAQPNACPCCGPRVRIERLDGGPLDAAGPAPIDAVAAASRLLLDGCIIAVKGIGGYHLACDATNSASVERLRRAKQRYAKPFALMARDLEVLRRYVDCGPQEAALLQSSAAPIVLLRAKRMSEQPRSGKTGSDGGASAAPAITAAVAPAQSQLGFMLPYTPLHRLLLDPIDRPIVLTSGNRSDEPQCIDDAEVGVHLGPMADYVLWHDRAIVNRVDDSVARPMAGRPRLLRRSRGYAPAPLPLPPGFAEDFDLLAMGGELKNTFCLVKGGQAILSQHMGDLENAAAFADYEKNLALYERLFAHRPRAIAVDAHPEYLSGKLGRRRARDLGLPLLEVFHHHAHIAACLAENRHGLADGEVLGVALDGLGLGPEGGLWGGEFLRADYRRCERVASFKPVAMLGGALAMREPWRNTYAHLMAALGWEVLKADYGSLELVDFLDRKPGDTLDAMLAKGINAPPASSCGRLFDAVAAAVGLCREQALYEGQAALELEAVVDPAAVLEEDQAPASYPFAIAEGKETGLPIIEPLPMWRALLGDLAAQTPRGVMAARFHLGLARAIVDMVCRCSEAQGKRVMSTVALSGGVFQNRVLFEQVDRHLRAEGYRVLSHARVPANDGGLSLGQAMIALALCQS